MDQDGSADPLGSLEGELDDGLRDGLDGDLGIDEASSPRAWPASAATVMGVSTTPGQTAARPMPSSARVGAKARTKPTTACFVRV